MMTLQANVTIRDTTEHEAKHVRVLLDAWADGRGIDRPTVMLVVSPAPGQPAIAVDDYHRLDRRLVVQLVDPGPLDLLDLARVVGPFAWPGLPELTLTRGAPTEGKIEA
jgi:hypothetical protein